MKKIEKIIQKKIDLVTQIDEDGSFSIIPQPKKDRLKTYRIPEMDGIGRTTVNVFFNWFMYLENEDDLIPQWGLQAAYLSRLGHPNHRIFQPVKTIRSNGWVRKFLKNEIPEISQCRLRVHCVTGSNIGPVWIWAVINDNPDWKAITKNLKNGIKTSSENR